MVFFMSLWDDGVSRIMERHSTTQTVSHHPQTIIIFPQANFINNLFQLCSHSFDRNDNTAKHIKYLDQVWVV